MKFIDEVEIEVEGGKGGPGSRHFRREKFVPLGGPDGGNGGKGGSVKLVADANKHTLLDFHYKPHWKARDGAAGDGSRKDGKDGKDEVIPVPLGTQVLDVHTGELLFDLCKNGQEQVLAKGGRGGKGNAFFKSPTNRAPEYAQPGEEGEQAKYKLSLKLIADVGLVGLPNAGKSTFISKVSNARPKVADYPFTTLEPHLGVVKYANATPFVVADIPGLIPGASQGKGMGVQFLKHIERAKVLLHLVDPLRVESNGELCDPVESFKLINHELEQFGDDLSNKPYLVVISKADAIPESMDREQLINKFKELNLECCFISSASGEGVNQLLEKILSLLS